MSRRSPRDPASRGNTDRQGGYRGAWGTHNTQAHQQTSTHGPHSHPQSTAQAPTAPPRRVLHGQDIYRRTMIYFSEFLGLKGADDHQTKSNSSI